ncbi:MAG: hypothetical protein ACK559_41620, partial [bacterium]
MAPGLHLGQRRRLHRDRAPHGERAFAVAAGVVDDDGPPRAGRVLQGLGDAPAPGPLLRELDRGLLQRADGGAAVEGEALQQRLVEAERGGGVLHGAVGLALVHAGPPGQGLEAAPREPVHVPGQLQRADH